MLLKVICYKGIEYNHRFTLSEFPTYNKSAVDKQFLHLSQWFKNLSVAETSERAFDEIYRFDNIILTFNFLFSLQQYATTLVMKLQMFIQV